MCLIGLEGCRCQRVEWPERPNVRVMLDGAHTEQVRLHWDSFFFLPPPNARRVLAYLRMPEYHCDVFWLCQSMAQAVRWLDAEYQRDQDARGKDKREDGRRRRALVFNCSAEKVWRTPPHTQNHHRLIMARTHASTTCRASRTCRDASGPAECARIAAAPGGPARGPCVPSLRPRGAVSRQCHAALARLHPQPTGHPHRRRR